MSVIRLPSGRQGSQESEPISLFCVDPLPPRVFVIEFVSRVSAEPTEVCDRLAVRAAGDYRLRLNPRGTKAHHRNCKPLFHPSAINERRRDRGRRHGGGGEEGGGQRAASARMAESSSHGLSWESRVRAGRCTYANGKVAIKILRKRYHAACRAGAAFILARRAQCDCWAS